MSPGRHRHERPPTRHADPRQAVSRYMETIRRAESAGSPAPAAALNGLGDAYLDLGDGTLAAHHHLEAAEAYAQETLWDNAVACCRKVLRREPDNPRAALLLGRSYAAKGLRAEALDVLGSLAGERRGPDGGPEVRAALEEIVRIMPQDARLRERLGGLLHAEGRHQEALNEYRAALDLCLGSGDPAGAEHARMRIEGLERAMRSASLSSPPREPTTRTD